MDATKRVTSIVEAMHRAIAPIFLSGFVYSTIRWSTERVGDALDLVLRQLDFGELESGAGRDNALAVLNGIIGDYLADTANPLAVPFRVRVAKPGKRMLVMVHGSCMSEHMWGADHGRQLADELGYGLAYVTYNSGLHISDNGKLLAEALAAFDDVTLIGFSMGGLVARSALHLGGKARTLITICAPHHGAALERGGMWLHALLGVSAYSRPIGTLARLRSAGVTDLRHGTIVEADWRGRDRFALSRDERTPVPLPAGVRCFGVAATPDGLVSVESALGLPFEDTLLVPNTSHMGALNNTHILAKLREWLTPSAS